MDPPAPTLDLLVGSTFNIYVHSLHYIRDDSITMKFRLYPPPPLSILPIIGFFQPSYIFGRKTIYNLCVNARFFIGVHFRICSISYHLKTVQLGQLIMYYTPKKVLPFAFFFNLPGLQKPLRNRFSDKSC